MSKAYLKYIRSLDCCITGTPAFGEHQIQAHHVVLNERRAYSRKTSDYKTIPLRSDVHMLLHHNPRKFWEDQGLNPHQIALDILVTYLEQNK